MSEQILLALTSGTIVLHTATLLNLKSPTKTSPRNKVLRAIGYTAAPLAIAAPLYAVALSVDTPGPFAVTPGLQGWMALFLITLANLYVLAGGRTHVRFLRRFRTEARKVMRGGALIPKARPKTTPRSGKIISITDLPENRQPSTEQPKRIRPSKLRTCEAQLAATAELMEGLGQGAEWATLMDEVRLSMSEPA